jgi:SpoIID/LytB domain protein
MLSRLNRFQSVLAMQGLVFFALFLFFPGLVHPADELARGDLAAILFSNRLQFYSDNQPMVPVGLMDFQDQISFSSKVGVDFLPSGPGGPMVEVRGGHQWTASLINSHPGRTGWVLVLARVPTRDFTAIRNARSLWRNNLGEVDLMEVGTVFGFHGKVLDTRETLVLDKTRYEAKALAREAAGALRRAHGASLDVLEVMVERPRGEILVTSRRGDTSFKVQDALWFRPRTGGDLTIKKVEHGRGFNWHGREDRTYVGSFYIAVDKYGKLAVANVLPAERLLRGLVPAEMYVSAPQEALKAQAVTARGELLSKIGRRHLTDPYLICAHQDCQVYKGVGAERDKTNQAVQQTRGRMLFYGERLADARYHSNCGGHTEDSQVAWPGVESEELRGRWDLDQGMGVDLSDEVQVAAYLDKQPGSWCSKSGKSGSTLRWRREFTQGELDKLVAGSYQVGHVLALTPKHRGVSGRMNHLEIEGSKGTVQVRGELVIRRLLGGLKSSAFYVKYREGAGTGWVLIGGGFGHGVGMCQHGAMGMGKEGKTFDQILRHYYKDTTIEQIY